VAQSFNRVCRQGESRRELIGGEASRSAIFSLLRTLFLVEREPGPWAEGLHEARTTQPAAILPLFVCAPCLAPSCSPTPFPGLDDFSGQPTADRLTIISEISLGIFLTIVAAMESAAWTSAELPGPICHHSGGTVR